MDKRQSKVFKWMDDQIKFYLRSSHGVHGIKSLAFCGNKEIHIGGSKGLSNLIKITELKPQIEEFVYDSNINYRHTIFVMYKGFKFFSLVTDEELKYYYNL